MMELKTLRDMIAAVYGGLYAEDCAMVDREWARMRGYILPTDGRSALRPAPVQAGAMHPEQQPIQRLGTFGSGMGCGPRALPESDLSSDLDLHEGR